MTVTTLASSPHCATGMAMTAWTANSTAVLAGMTVFGAGFGVAQSASMNLMLARAQRSHYGLVNAAWNASYDLGWGAGAIGIGFVVTAAGYPVAFAATAALVLAAIPAALRTVAADVDSSARLSGPMCRPAGLPDARRL